MARGERPGDGPPPLPAPYRSPWGALSEALGAVAADLWLQLRRLWRRNREGELPRPEFWPQGLAAVFWPLLLGAALVLLLALGLRLLDATAASARLSGAAAPAVKSAEEPSAADQAEGLIRALQTPRTGDAMPSSAPAARDLSSQEAAGAGERSSEDGSERSDGPATAELRLDPLLALLSEGQEGNLLLAVQPDPARSRLSLTLSPAAEGLSQAALLQQADRWQQRALAAGYEQLELRDARGRLRGRQALVGSGMILLAPVPAS